MHGTPVLARRTKANRIIFKHVQHYLQHVTCPAGTRDQIACRTLSTCPGIQRKRIACS